MRLSRLAEWQHAIDNPTNLALFDKTTEKYLRRIIKGQPLGAKFKMGFKRQSSLVTSGNSAIEIAVDQGIAEYLCVFKS